HALVMADLLLGGGVVLPPPEDSIYVFDEGHHLPAVAVDQGGVQTRLLDPQRWLDDVQQLPQRGARAVTTDTALADAMLRIAPQLAADTPRLGSCLSEVQRYLAGAHPRVSETGGRGRHNRPDANWRFAGGVVPEPLRHLFGQAHDACESVYAQALKFDKLLRKAVDKQPDDRALGALQSASGWLSGRLGQMHAALAQMAAS